MPEWRELVWTYIKNPDIPIVAFERVAEQFPLRVEKILRSLIGDKDFSLEHLYAVLLHYKQPVDGLKDLKDDQNLWDLFNGNAAPAKSVTKARKPRFSQATPQSQSKTTAKQSAKKTSARSPAAHVSGPARKPGVKSATAAGKRRQSRDHLRKNGR